MKSVSTFRFVLWLMIISAGWLAFMSQHTFSSSLLLGCSGIVLISRHESARRVPAKELIYIFAVLGAFIVTVVVVPRIWSDSQIIPVVTHPAVVVPLWIITAAGGILEMET
jgi:hypothetical protein